MSGGSLEYVFGRIDDAADSVKNYVAEVEKHDAEDFAFDAKRAGLTPEQMKERTISYLKTAVLSMRLASIYAQRAEWLMSCDDGYESFISRTDEEIGVLANELKESGYPTGIVLGTV